MFHYNKKNYKKVCFFAVLFSSSIFAADNTSSQESKDSRGMNSTSGMTALSRKAKENPNTPMEAEDFIKLATSSLPSLLPEMDKTAKTKTQINVLNFLKKHNEFIETVAEAEKLFDAFEQISEHLQEIYKKDADDFSFENTLGYLKKIFDSLSEVQKEQLRNS